VSDATAPPPKRPTFSRRIREAAAADPALAAIALYALIAMGATVSAYLAIFTQFAPYDDEGTLLLTVKAFAQGEVLYRDIYSAYGPFYYELFGGLFAIGGFDVTTNASRTIVVLLWVGASFLFGLAAQRLSDSVVLGGVGMITAFAALGVLINEPMHPQGLCVLLLGAFLALAACEPARRSGWLGAASGALLAALLLTKINLGIFAIAAVVLAVVWTVRPLYRRRWLRWAVIAAFLAMPLFILARDLNLAWVRELLVLEVLAAAAILIAALPLSARQGDDEGGLKGWLLAAGAGFAAAFVVILGAVLLTGPSPSDLYDGVITEAMRVRDVLVLQFQFPQAVVSWGVLAVAAATLTARLGGGELAEPKAWGGLLRAAAGLAIFFSVTRIVLFGLDPAGGNPDVIPMVLAWVAAVPLAGVRESAHRRFLRVLVPALAVAETLQVYPVAGSQAGIAAVTFVPVGALCLGDAWKELRAWGARRGGARSEQVGIVATVSALALAGILALQSIVLPAASNGFLYRDQAELPLPGANLLHLPAPTVETYTGIVGLLQRHRCTAFVGYPSINSLYLWSGIDAPTPQLPNGWMRVFDRAQQQRVVDQLRASPRPCAIRSDERASMYLLTGAAADLPLVRYVFNDFRPAAQVGDFQFLLPKNQSR
jgi:hypothetical protein